VRAIATSGPKAPTQRTGPLGARMAARRTTGVRAISIDARQTPAEKDIPPGKTQETRVRENEENNPQNS